MIQHTVITTSKKIVADPMILFTYEHCKYYADMRGCTEMLHLVCEAKLSEFNEVWTTEENFNSQISC